MSVIVMGGEFPTGYDDCWYLGCKLWRDCAIDGKQYDCPLRPLPYVHGDLIDRDTIGGKFIPRQAYFTEEIKRKIGLIPSVVEAEGD